MKIEIYTIPDCIWCKKTEQVLKMANITEYEKYTIGEGDITFEYIQKRFPRTSGYPVIVIDGKTIPGIVDLVKLFLDKGLISSRKKNE
jgi:glutaredoxin